MSESTETKKHPELKRAIGTKLLLLFIVGDILGNTTLVDVLWRLIDSREGEALGLAFDAEEARRGPTTGFEFRFYRAADSRGWFSSASGASAYTVANIRLDVRPVEIAGPLYK